MEGLRQVIVPCYLVLKLDGLLEEAVLSYLVVKQDGLLEIDSCTLLSSTETCFIPLAMEFFSRKR